MHFTTSGRRMPIKITIIKSRLSYRIGVLILLTLLLLAASAWGLCAGSIKLSFSEIIDAMNSGVGVARQIVWDIRLPRVILCAIVGAALALSGAILQGIMRNPLASPNIIGVTSGGGLAAVLILVVFPAYSQYLVWAAFGGALTAALAIYLVAWNHGAQPIKLILSGVAISSLLGAAITAILLFNPERVIGVLDFSVGSLSSCSWSHLKSIWPYALSGGILALLGARDLNIIALGDEVATGLGQRVELSRFIFLAVAALLAASAVSVVGLLGFVGLVAPHMIRIIIGADFRWLMPGCAIFGAALLITCDTIGRLVMAPLELPAGVIMALIGPPFFLWLLKTRLKHET
ncbi:MAG: iron ABC transporter permease [Victivallaceae bacterium]|nr:iron ABC transporter permease [Victivallaceae bacterium]MDD3704317.1 iron ABC transporter permease [Victivallaceae bacterium]MDD4318358.1 iron ABC transporter permease [Victivallaceae bacterium]MDD5664007.1 iron ABC transporter permease [Victivallaceae bacterium]